MICNDSLGKIRTAFKSFGYPFQVYPSTTAKWLRHWRTSGATSYSKAREKENSTRAWLVLYRWISTAPDEVTLRQSMVGIGAGDQDKLISGKTSTPGQRRKLWYSSNKIHGNFINKAENWSFLSTQQNEAPSPAGSLRSFKQKTLEHRFLFNIVKLFTS